MVLAAGSMARTAHFALHQAALEAPANGERKVAPLWPRATAPSVWVGAMVPKRWAKLAVRRNAIKREIYRTASQFETGLPALANLVRLRASFNREQFVSATSQPFKQALRQELHSLFAQAQRPLNAAASGASTP